LIFTTATFLLAAECICIQTIFIEALALGAGCHDSLGIHDLCLHNHIALPHFMHNEWWLLASMIGLEVTDICASAGFAWGCAETVAADDMSIAILVVINNWLVHDDIAAKSAFSYCG